MYEAMRQRACNSSQLAGVSATVLVLAATSYLVLTGLGAQFVRAVLPTPIFVPVPETAPPDPAPQNERELDTTTELDQPPLPPIPLDEFKPVGPPPIAAPETGASDTGASVGPSPAPVRKWPAMKTTEKPDYPSISTRLKEEGVTGLTLCVGANGRVTSVNLASSSGFTRLDEAALKWVRGVRFAPGTLDGAAQPMCGHRVFYEWELTDARG